jgi:hypothetical protein
MKLLQIWNAKEAWGRFSKLKKPPGMAYRMLTYGKQIQSELEVCELQRQHCVCEAAGVEHGTPEAAATTLLPFDENLKPNQKYIEFQDKFNKFLDTEAALSWVGITMQTLAEALDAGQNTISDEDLALLESFFTEKPKADLKLVDQS